MSPEDQVEAEKLRMRQLDASPPFFSSLVEKIKNQPFILGGVLVFTTIAGVGAYRWKTRKTQAPSLYLIQLRVLAQGATVGIFGIGMIYQMLNDFVFNDKKALATKKD